jgi:hypothetical protein
VILLLSVGPVVGCGSGESTDSAGALETDDSSVAVSGIGSETTDSDIANPPASDWNWQLNGDLNMSVDAEVWDIDLFDSTAEDIAALHDNGKYVICYFSAGSIEDWRPDVGGIEDSAIGLPLDDWPGERWLDVRARSVIEMLSKRIEMASSKDCDAVEPDNVDGFGNETGFSLTSNDQIEFNMAIAEKAHSRRLAVGLKNSFNIVEQLVSFFDFAVTEQCHEYDECELVGPFLEQGKPVFNAEYSGGENEAMSFAEVQCTVANQIGIHTLFMPIDLDGSWRISCS